MTIDVYYKISGDILYLTNQNKDGYTWKNTSAYDAAGWDKAVNKRVIIELYNDKFVFPRYCYRLFYKCKNTTFNDMDKWDLTQATEINYVFGSCTNLTSVDLSSWDVSNCTIFGGLFCDCTSLTSITWPEVFDMRSSRCNMPLMFKNCTSLTSLDLSSWANMATNEFANSTEMFSGCSKLTRIDAAPGSDWSTLITLEHSTNMFNGCTKLRNWDGTTDITRANNTKTNGYFTYAPIYVTWKNWDGTVLEGPTEVDITTTTVPTYHGTIPTRQAPSVYNHYEFTGWDPLPSSWGKKTTTFTAQFELKTTYYRITFKRGGGTSDILQMDDLEYGVTPSYRGSTPERPTQYGTIFSFAGWSPEITPVTKSQDYVAQYNSQVDPRVPTIYYHNGTDWELIVNIYQKDSTWKRIFPLIKENGVWYELPLH